MLRVKNNLELVEFVIFFGFIIERWSKLGKLLLYTPRAMSDQNQYRERDCHNSDYPYLTCVNISTW